MLQNFWPLIKDRIKLLGSDNQCDAKKEIISHAYGLQVSCISHAAFFYAIGGVQAPY